MCVFGLTYTVIRQHWRKLLQTHNTATVAVVTGLCGVHNTELQQSELDGSHWVSLWPESRVQPVVCFLQAELITSGARYWDFTQRLINPYIMFTWCQAGEILSFTCERPENEEVHSLRLLHCNHYEFNDKEHRSPHRASCVKGRGLAGFSRRTEANRSGSSRVTSVSKTLEEIKFFHDVTQILSIISTQINKNWVYLSLTSHTLFLLKAGSGALTGGHLSQVCLNVITWAQLSTVTPDKIKMSSTIYLLETLRDMSSKLNRR